MAAKSFSVPINLNQFEIQNGVIQLLGSDPASPVNGQIWINSNTWVLKVRLNGVTVQLGRLDQISPPTASINANSQRITSVADPVSAQDAATQQWVSNFVSGQISGQDWKAAVRVATTTALPSNTYATGALTATANGALTVDGVGVVASDRVLVKNEPTGSHNGIYVVTNPGTAGAPYVLTRAGDANVTSDLSNGMTVPVLSGSTQADTLWLQTADSVTLDTTALAFSQVGGAGATYTAASPITLVGNQFSLTTVPVNLGGTGATSAAAARTNLGTVGKYPASGSVTGPSAGGTSWTVTHNLGTTEVVYMLRDSSNIEVIADVVVTDANTLTINFGASVSANAYKIVVIG